MAATDTLGHKVEQLSSAARAARPISAPGKRRARWDYNNCVVEIESLKIARFIQIAQEAYEYGEDSVYYDAQNGLRNFVHEFAVRLRDYGQKLLKGDLSELPAMASVIKKRAEDGRDGTGAGM